MTSIIKIDLESKTPTYKQIADQIIELIAKGKLKPGDKLPSIRELASMLGVNMLTVNKAYNYLVNEGFIVVQKRRYVVKSEVRDDSWKSMLRVVIYRALASNKNRDEIVNEINRIISEANTR
ncbi:GntR family transcriptional regulator [Sulfolobus acidocaldarius SUSAZ]|nr:GntR family transcriptional regulator [Sulfolobus acidocaldarius SUSAZ]